MTYLIKLAKQPVEELKFGAFEIFLSLARLNEGWGIDVLFSHAGFSTYLLDQASESTYAAKEFKYTVAVAVLANSSSHLLNQEFIAKLEAIKMQGPHYIPAKMLDPATMEG